eukprot:gene5663-biopygen4792
MRSWRLLEPGRADKAQAALATIEASPSPGATRPAGHGISIDWSILAGWTPPYPWLLAGGLTPENVAEAVRLSGATARHRIPRSSERCC